MDPSTLIINRGFPCSPQLTETTSGVRLPPCQLLVRRTLQTDDHGLAPADDFRDRTEIDQFAQVQNGYAVASFLKFGQVVRTDDDRRPSAFLRTSSLTF